MDQPPPESSFTPPDTPLSASPRYPDQNSSSASSGSAHTNTTHMEEPDPEGARTPKRQRVDSGSGVHETLSIEAAAAASATASTSAEVVPSQNNVNNVNNVNSVNLPQQQQPLTSSDTTSPRPSKVTINMKSPTSEVVDLPDPASTLTSVQSPPDAAASASAPVPDTAPTPTPIPESNDVSLSSPEASPQIEIADPEDMEQDSSNSNWRPLEEVVQGDPHPGLDFPDTASLEDLFPRFRSDIPILNNIQGYCQVLEKGDMHEAAAILQKLQIWMDHCARNLDALTPEAYFQHRNLWENLPHVVGNLLRRKTDLPIDENPDLLPCIRDFLLDFARISLHLVQEDIAVLRELPDDSDQQIPGCMSQQYLQHLGWAISYRNLPLYRSLDRFHGPKARNIFLEVQGQFLGPLNATEKIADHCALILELIPKHPELFPMLFCYVRTTFALLDCTLQFLEDSDVQDLTVADASSAWTDHVYQMGRSIDTKYQDWITKKSPWLTSELSEKLQLEISRNMQFFCHRGDTFIHRLAKDLSIELPDDANSEENMRIVLGGWKFGVFKKHFMEGRMELRVHGVERMQNELIEVWKDYIRSNPDGSSRPFIQYLVRFIKENKIVDYLVGVDSHAQLISRSSNIVGFLVVTSEYTDHETDIIWKAVTESEDSRIVSEILSMLINTFPIHTTASPSLLYLCEKVASLPLDRFDPRMLEFCKKLLDQSTYKPVSGPIYLDHPDPKHAHAIPLRLCVRMIRESTAAGSLSADQQKQLQNFGSNRLSELMKAGISEDDRTEVYEQCIHDISEMNQFTTGSIQAITALVSEWDTREIRKLARDFDLTRLVIDEMLHTVNETNFELADCFSQHGLASRVEILSRLISEAPETITPDLASALWNQILLSPRMGTQGHKSVWTMMVNSLGSSSPNVFLDRCIHEYMPNLTPKDYDHELLLFAKQSVNYEVLFNPPPTADENEVVFIPGMDRIWDIILTTPPGTIEFEATNFAIEVYLDHKIIQSSPRSAVESTHVALVARCVNQLKSAAAAIKSRVTPGSASMNGATPMDTGESIHDQEKDELIFKRSLLFLHRLLDGVRARPRYSPPQESPPMLPQRPLKGNPLDLRWQSYQNGTPSKIHSLRIGDESTAADLVEKFVQLTGFSKFSAIGGGARLDLLEKPEAILRDIKNLHSGLLIIRKAPDSEVVPRNTRYQSLTSVDAEVMKHFDDIYPFLALGQELAQQTYTFLVDFPPKESVLDRLKSQDSKAEDLFPFNQPYVAFYMLDVLRQCTEDEASEVSPNPDFLQHSIHILLELLMADELSQSSISRPTTSGLAANAVDILLSVISLHPLESGDRALLSEPQPVVKRLSDLIEMACSPESAIVYPIGKKLTCNSFAVLVEASMRDHKFWTAVKDQVQIDGLMQRLLFEEQDQANRANIAERIKKACGSQKSSKRSSNAKTVDEGSVSVACTENASQIDMLVTMWQSLANLIPKTLEHATQCAEFFKVCIVVFLTVTGGTYCQVTLDQYVNEWSVALFQRLALRTEEFVGRETVDEVVLGLSVLLESCLETAELAGVEVHTSDIGEKILGEHLFPDLSPDPSPDMDGLIVPQIPILHNETRHKLLSIVYLISKRSDQNVASTIKQLDGLIPRGQSKLASLRTSNILFSDACWDPDHQYNGSWIIERQKTLRAPEGYAGLTNLSNTCYLNSLMTQLFMNVEFRDFILKLQLIDSDSSQKLLDQTRKVFALMQNSWLKSVDPIEFVESIRTYDNEAIDVTIQMDVDEFYNLLFDRCEAQIVDPEEKKKFRSFYGGQLVQQIKSKECPHISERLEPFSAIQCDIKGKANLQESLEAYVEGEIMQGDNKYSCTSCGRHVDAVKRACLKEVPDNLIFHLKRFDFDMVTMLRSKINDQFEFPQLIDMSPYNVEYLSEPEAPVEPDVFELVGVLVHTGTAESGHYYSYTRERPTTGDVSSWVEFNDADVSRFDPLNIPDQCFGGQTDSMHSLGGVPINKLWNAYMLFYQRVSSIDECKEIYKPSKPGFPIHTSVPTPLANSITLDNELFIRSYCLLDPIYTSLVSYQMQHVQNMSPDFPNKQTTESTAVSVGLDTFEQLIARNKSHPGLENNVSQLHGLLRQNSQTAFQTLWWFCEHPTSIANLVLKTAVADSEIRHQGLNLIMAAVKHYQKLLSNSDMDGSERGTWQVQFDRVVETIVDLFAGVWPNVLPVARAWDDYFEFLCHVAETSMENVGILLDHGFLTKCLEVLWLDVHDKARLRGYFLQYCKLVDKGRRFSYKHLMNLCTMLIRNIDLSLRPVAMDEERTLSTTGKYPPNVKEARYLMHMNDEGCLLLLLKIFQNDQFSELTNSRQIIAAYLVSEPDAGLLGDILKTLETGLQLLPADVCIPYLDAALVFCKRSPTEASVHALMTHVAKAVETINNTAGFEHLEFFIMLCQAENLRAGLTIEWFNEVVQSLFPDFTPTLLIDTNRVVRNNTLELLRKLLFVDEDEITEEAQARHSRIAHELVDACMLRISKSFLEGNHHQTVQSRQISAITATLRHCLDKYFDDSEDDLKVMEQANHTLLILEQLTVEVPDDLISESDLPSPDEWENTSPMASDDELGLAVSP